MNRAIRRVVADRILLEIQVQVIELVSLAQQYLVETQARDRVDFFVTLLPIGNKLGVTIFLVHHAAAHWHE